MHLSFPVSNWQKVQLNTDVLNKGHRYLYAMQMLNEN